MLLLLLLLLLPMSKILRQVKKVKNWLRHVHRYQSENFARRPQLDAVNCPATQTLSGWPGQTSACEQSSDVDSEKALHAHSLSVIWIDWAQLNVIANNLFHRLTRTVYLYNGCLPLYNVVLTSWVHSSVNTVNSHSCGLVWQWNKCVKPLPVVVKVR